LQADLFVFAAACFSWPTVVDAESYVVVQGAGKNLANSKKSHIYIIGGHMLLKNYSGF